MNEVVPTVERFMTAAPYSMDSDNDLASACSLMMRHKIRHLPIVHHNQLVGMLTDRDAKLVAAFVNVDLDKVKVSEAMTKQPYTVSPETSVDEVARTMAEHKYGSAVVMKNLEVVGIFTTVDVCRALTELTTSPGN